MKSMLHGVLLVALLGVGAACMGAPDPSTREVKADALEKAAMDKLSAQRAEIDAALEQVRARQKAHQAETAAIMSLLGATHLRPGEEFVSYKAGVFTIALVGSR
jgi:hypothetical protein